MQQCSIVSRRTGGLEIDQINKRGEFVVSRRTGGLEMKNGLRMATREVSRRTGGLEKIFITSD